VPELTIEECQAILEKHRVWFYSAWVRLPDDHRQMNNPEVAARELAQALAAALTRNERIARARNRGTGFARLYRDKALAYQREIEDMKGELRVLAERMEGELRG